MSGWRTTPCLWEYCSEITCYDLNNKWLLNSYLTFFFFLIQDGNFWFWASKSSNHLRDFILMRYFRTHREIWLLLRVGPATCRPHRACWTNRGPSTLGSSASRWVRCRMRTSGPRTGRRPSSGPWARCSGRWAAAYAAPNRFGPKKI